MQLLFRLPIVLLETAVRRGLGALFGLAERVRGQEDDVVSAVPSAAPSSYDTPSRTDERPPPTAEEALERRFTREAAAANGAPATGPASPARPQVVPETPHVDREAEVVASVGPADDVMATIAVEEPWTGYDELSAPTIVARLREADLATKGVVRLYEQQHKKRATVIRATA